MAVPIILVSIGIFVCGLISKLKLYPWLLSFLSIPSDNKPEATKKKKMPQGGGSIAVAYNQSPSVDLSFIFSTFDKDGDGFITVTELAESLRRLGIPATETEVAKMVEQVDANGDGLIDLHEFQDLYDAIEQGSVESREGDEGEEEADSLREAFDVFDGNGDGVITVEELRLVLRSMGMKQGEKAEDCRDMIRKVDLDGDGMVDFEEFKNMMTAKGGNLF